MNVTIIYFSQTGNTRVVAETMADVFREKGQITRTVSLKKATPQDAITCDLLGVGAPCFSSQAPAPIKEFLRSLPPLEKQKAFVFATSGGAPGRVLYDLASLLQGKGAVVSGGFLTRGEVHHPAPCLIGRFPHRPNAENLTSVSHFAEAITEYMSDGRSVRMAECRPEALKPKLNFYNSVGYLSTDGFLRLVLPEPKLDIGQCNQCQWCVNECPMHNIALKPYPIYGQKCIRCYRCLTGCPQKAFKADWRLGNLATLLFYSTTLERWFGDVKPGEQVYADA